MDMARERRDEHTSLGVLDDMQQRGTDLRLGFGETRDRGVGGVGQQQIDALLTKAGDGAIVGVTPSMGVWSSLKSPGMHHGARRRLEKHAERAGSGVRR